MCIRVFRGLIKSQIAVTLLQSRPQVEPEDLHFWQGPSFCCCCQPRDHTLRNTVRVSWYSNYGPWTTNINISWKLVRKAKSQTQHQIYWIRICILTNSLGDLFAHWKFEKHWSSGYRQSFGELRVWIIQTWVQVSVLPFSNPVTSEEAFFFFFFNFQCHLEKLGWSYL